MNFIGLFNQKERNISRSADEFVSQKTLLVIFYMYMHGHDSWFCNNCYANLADQIN